MFFNHSFKRYVLLMTLVSWCPNLWAMDLMHVYRQALKNDQTYQTAKATWHAAEQAMPLARASLMPSLSLSGYYHRFHATESGAGHSDDNFSYSASLAQSVFDYAAWQGLSEASLTVRGARATLAEAAQQVMVTTLSDYFAVLSAIEQREVTKQTRLYAKESYRQISAKYKVGMATVADLYAARSALDLQEASYVSDVHAVAIAMEDLSVLTGTRYKTLKTVGVLKLMPPAPNHISAWAKRATKNNYALKASYLNARALHEAVSIAENGRMPTVSLTGTYSRTSQNTPSSLVLSAAPINESMLSLDASIPVYQGGAVSALAKQAYFNEQVALSSYRLLRRQTVANARKYFMNVTDGIRLIKADRLAVASADSALNAAQEAYKAGTETLTDLLETIKDFAAANQSLIEARYAYLLNIALLEQSVGSLKAGDIATLSELMTNTVALEEGKKHETKTRKKA